MDPFENRHLIKMQSHTFCSFCGMQQPGVYTNLGRYLDWIENIVWPVTEQKSTPPTTVPSSSESTTAGSSSTIVKSTTKQTPRSQRPKTTRKPIFLADMPQTTVQVTKTTIENIPTTTVVIALTTIEQSTKMPHPNATLTTSYTNFIHYTTTAKSDTIITLNSANYNPTQNPNNIPADQSELLNSLLGYGKNITRASKNSSISNVTSNVSSILSIVNGI